MNVKDIRRENLRSLSKNIGGITAIARKLNKSQSQISHLIGSRPIKNIGDRLAAEIEKNFDKPHGWLDKEHFRIKDQSGIYVISNDAPRVLSWTPIINWEDLANGISASSNNAKEFVPVNFQISPEAFAVRVTDDSMEAPVGISFPKGTVVIIDPSHIPTHTSYVIAYSNQTKKPTFKQLVHEGHKKFLKPLNPRYETEPLADNAKVIGVVRQLMMKLE